MPRVTHEAVIETVHAIPNGNDPMTPSNEGQPLPRRHWTARVYLRANPLMRPVLNSPFHRIVSGRVVLLGITGRRSGKHYEICVGYARPSPDVLDILVSDASNRSWWRNFMGGGPIEVLIHGRERVGHATAHRAPGPEFKEIADRAIPGIVGRVGAQRFFAVPDFDPVRGLSQEDLDRLAGFAVAVTINLAPEIG